MKQSMNWGILSIAFILIWVFMQLDPLNHYIQHKKINGNQTYTVLQQKDKFSYSEQDLTEEELQILNQIKTESAKLNIKPIDAKLDPIWKAIPGYNGLVVDIEKTFYYARKFKGSIPYIYNEVSPKVSIEQLGAQPIYKGNSHKRMVAIMINVAWGNEHIPSILKTLEAENVLATFFLDGSWLKNNVDIAKQIHSYGHELSNHAFSHKNMSDLSQAEAIEEINKTQKLLKQHLNVDNKLFAPPSGDFGVNTLNIAFQMKLKTILWTIDTVDWKDPEPAWIINKVSLRLEPGAMILMHPKLSSALALPKMIQEIKNKGLVLGTVSELISTSRVEEVEPPFNF